MVQSDQDLLSYIAEEICDELYAVAKKDPRIMVNDWCAYAVQEAYRQTSILVGGIVMPSLDDLFAGYNIPNSLLLNEKWMQLKEWHEFHLKRSFIEEWEDFYWPDLIEPTLKLEHFVLHI